MHKSFLRNWFVHFRLFFNSSTVIFFQKSEKTLLLVLNIFSFLFFCFQPIAFFVFFRLSQKWCRIFSFFLPQRKTDFQSRSTEQRNNDWIHHSLESTLCETRSNSISCCWEPQENNEHKTVTWNCKSTLLERNNAPQIAQPSSYVLNNSSVNHRQILLFFGIRHSEETWHHKVIYYPSHLQTVEALPGKCKMIIFKIFNSIPQ